MYINKGGFQCCNALRIEKDEMLDIDLDSVFSKAD